MKPLPTAADVATNLGETVTPGTPRQAQLQQHVSGIIEYARTYTRGRGFKQDMSGQQQVAPGIWFVIVSAAVRSASNPAHMTQMTSGPFTAQPGRFQGFTYTEKATLDNYRVKAW